MSSDNPDTSSHKPEMPSDHPGMSLYRSEVSSNDPEISSDDPEMSSGDPEVSSDDPEVSSDDLEKSFDNPEMSSGDTDIRPGSGKPFQNGAGSSNRRRINYGCFSVFAGSPGVTVFCASAGFLPTSDSNAEACPLCMTALFRLKTAASPALRMTTKPLSPYGFAVVVKSVS